MPAQLTPPNITKAYVGSTLRDGETLFVDYALVLTRCGGFDVVPVNALPIG